MDGNKSMTSSCFVFFVFFSCDTDLSTQSLNAVMVLCCVCVVREKKP